MTINNKQLEQAKIKLQMLDKQAELLKLEVAKGNKTKNRQQKPKAPLIDPKDAFRLLGEAEELEESVKSELSNEISKRRLLKHKLLCLRDKKNNCATTVQRTSEAVNEERILLCKARTTPSPPTPKELCFDEEYAKRVFLAAIEQKKSEPLDELRIQIEEERKHQEELREQIESTRNVIQELREAAVNNSSSLSCSLSRAV